MLDMLVVVPPSKIKAALLGGNSRGKSCRCVVKVVVICVVEVRLRMIIDTRRYVYMAT